MGASGARPHQACCSLDAGWTVERGGGVAALPGFALCCAQHEQAAAVIWSGAWRGQLAVCGAGAVEGHGQGGGEDRGADRDECDLPAGHAPHPGRMTGEPCGPDA